MPPGASRKVPYIDERRQDKTTQMNHCAHALTHFTFFQRSCTDAPISGDESAVGHKGHGAHSNRSKMAQFGMTRWMVALF